MGEFSEDTIRKLHISSRVNHAFYILVAKYHSSKPSHTRRNYCTACNTRIARTSVPDFSPPPNLYEDLVAPVVNDIFEDICRLYLQSKPPRRSSSNNNPAARRHTDHERLRCKHVVVEGLYQLTECLAWHAGLPELVSNTASVASLQGSLDRLLRMWIIALRSEQSLRLLWAAQIRRWKVLLPTQMVVVEKAVWGDGTPAPTKRTPSSRHQQLQNDARDPPSVGAEYEDDDAIFADSSDSFYTDDDEEEDDFQEEENDDDEEEEEDEPPEDHLVEEEAEVEDDADAEVDAVVEDHRRRRRRRRRQQQQQQRRQQQRRRRGQGGVNEYPSSTSSNSSSSSSPSPESSMDDSPTTPAPLASNSSSRIAARSAGAPLRRSARNTAKTKQTCTLNGRRSQRKKSSMVGDGAGAREERVELEDGDDKLLLRDARGLHPPLKRQRIARTRNGGVARTPAATLSRNSRPRAHNNGTAKKDASSVSAAAGVPGKRGRKDKEPASPPWARTVKRKYHLRSTKNARPVLVTGGHAKDSQSRRSRHPHNNNDNNNNNNNTRGARRAAATRKGTAMRKKPLRLAEKKSTAKSTKPKRDDEYVILSSSGAGEDCAKQSE